MSTDGIRIVVNVTKWVTDIERKSALFIECRDAWENAMADFAIERLRLEAPQPGGGLSGGSTAGYRSPPRPFGYYSLGQLRDSFVKLRRARGGYSIVPTVPWAPIVSLGSKPHWITSSRYMVFEDATGRTYASKEVWHPGTKPNPYIKRARASVDIRSKYLFVEVFGRKFKSK